MDLVIPREWKWIVSLTIIFSSNFESLIRIPQFGRSPAIISWKDLLHQLGRAIILYQIFYLKLLHLAMKYSWELAAKSATHGHLNNSPSLLMRRNHSYRFGVLTGPYNLIIQWGVRPVDQGSSFNYDRGCDLWQHVTMRHRMSPEADKCVRFIRHYIWYWWAIPMRHRSFVIVSGLTTCFIHIA